MQMVTIYFIFESKFDFLKLKAIVYILRHLS